MGLKLSQYLDLDNLSVKNLDTFKEIIQYRKNELNNAKLKKEFSTSQSKFNISFSKEILQNHTDSYINVISSKSILYKDISRGKTDEKFEHIENLIEKEFALSKPGLVQREIINAA